ncbi:Multiple organellar RNA editing factor 1 mitochondrial [Euphorbia peplus]|nr:Multiple organellar RNA editing factor 1 mitochondrial [Euphorbia peplus]
MAMQTVRLRRAVTSLAAVHRSFYSPITSPHSPLPLLESMSVQPPPSFRLQSRPFSTPWYIPWKKDDAPKDEDVDPKDKEVLSGEQSDAADHVADAAVAAAASNDGNDSKEIVSEKTSDAADDAADAAVAAASNDSNDSKEIVSEKTSDDADREKNITDFLTKEELHDLFRSLKNDKDKDSEPLPSRDENGNFIYLTKEEIEEILTRLRNDPEVIQALKEEAELAKEIELRKQNGEELDDDWNFNWEDLGKEGTGDDLFKNVKPLSEYDIDSKLSKEDHGYMDFFKKYDIKELMKKAKEQEEKEKEEMKDYEGYHFMRHRQEDYHFNFFEEEEPRVPKNEDDIMEIFAGCDLKHWLVTVDFPDDPEPKREDMIATYERICAQGLGLSIEEAKKRIYACSTSVYDGFQVEMTKEETEKFIEIPEVMLVLPDSYLDKKNQEYGGDKYENGVITMRPPPFTYKKRERKKKKDSKEEKTGDNKLKLVPPPKVEGGSEGKQGANP